MKIEELRQSQIALESMSGLLDSVDFIKNHARKKLIAHVVKTNHASNQTERNCAINFVDHYLDNLIKSIGLKSVSSDDIDPLLDFLNADLTIKPMTLREKLSVPSIEDSIEAIVEKYSSNTSSFKDNVLNKLLSMDKKEFMVMKGVEFEEWEQENSSYKLNDAYNGLTLMRNIVNFNLSPDNIVIKDGDVILCFEEVGYILDKDINTELIEIGLKSINDRRLAKESQNQEIGEYDDYNKAKRFINILTDEYIDYFGDKEYETLKENQEALILMATQAVEMLEVWNVDRYMDNHKSAFDNFTPEMESVFKSTFQEAFKSARRMDVYIDSALQHKMRHANNLDFEAMDRAFEDKVEEGVSLYQEGDSKKINHFLENTNSLIAMAVKLKVNEEKEQEQTNDNVIPFR